MIEIVEYQTEWPGDFARLAAQLKSGLGSLALRIDHIGSTSVPGMPAKDRIDIQVAVADLNEFVSDAITSVGLIRHPRHDRDHTPPGQVAPASEWMKFLFHEQVGGRPTNIHVRRLGSPNYRFALLFRDYLIAHPASAEAYAELKRRLAVDLANPSAYAMVKDPAVDLIYFAAEAWATQVGWSPAEPEFTD